MTIPMALGGNFPARTVSDSIATSTFDIAVLGMEVRWIMLVIVHRYNDPEKPIPKNLLISGMGIAPAKNGMKAWVELFLLPHYATPVVLSRKNGQRLFFT